MSDVEETLYLIEDEPGTTSPADDFDAGTFGEIPPQEPGWDGEKVDEKRPARHEKRAPLADLVTLMWGGLGMFLVQSEVDVPVGRVLQFQAPLAGTKVDDLLANTWLDHVLQPFAKQADKIEGLGAVVLFPLLVGAYERNPALAPVVEPVLRQVVRSSLLDMAPMMRKRKAEERRAATTVGDLTEMFDLPKGADPIDAVLQAIFAPVVPPEGMSDDND